jgi:hypothetical protein
MEMKRTRHFSVGLALGALLVVGLLASPASGATATGTWVQYPTGATEYQAEVQQPINTANTSNWSAKSKGGIPVMYKLSSRIGPAAFESIYSDNPANTANDFAFLSFSPDTAITFNDLTDLTANYAFSLGDCHGGSLRWQVRVDSNSNGVLDAYDPDTNPGGDKAVFIYYGLPPSFGNDTDGAGPLTYEGGCTPSSNLGASQSGVNLLGPAEQGVLRFDTTQFNGIFYNDYAGAQAAAGTYRVWRASLVLDSGWQYVPNGDQRLEPGTTATVNGNTRQFVSSAGDPFTTTCDLPDAFIDVTKIDPTPDGPINETTVYPTAATDTDDQFRVVDCKYQYVLSIPSLNGVGTYDVEILIGGNPVDTNPNPPNEVRFDLK